MITNSGDKKNSQPQINKIDSLTEVVDLPVDADIIDNNKYNLGKYTLNQQSVESDLKISGDKSHDGKRFKTIIASSSSTNARPPVYTRIQHKRVASGG